MELNTIIEKAKDGDLGACDELVNTMIQNKCTKVINRYLNKNRLVDSEDLVAEFWIGVLGALPNVDMGIGNPLRYLEFMGRNRVKDMMRSNIRKRVQVRCNRCRRVSSLYRVEGEYVCRYCKADSSYLVTTQYETNMTTIFGCDYNEAYVEALCPRRTRINLVEIDIELIKVLLSPQELRVLELIQEGISSGNYLAAIADTMSISPQCVSQYVKKIRKKIGGLV